MFGKIITWIKNFYSILKLIYSCKNRNMILEVISLLKDSEKNIVMTVNSDDRDKILIYTSDDNFDTEFATACKEELRQTLINILQQQYDINLEHYEPYTALAFKEADYQMARADALDMELQYTKEINNPNGVSGPQLFNMWNRLQQLRDRVKAFDDEIENNNL